MGFSQDSDDSISPSSNLLTESQWSGSPPSVLIFDVNETLIDIESLAPFFQRVFGDERVLREWFGNLVMYSMTLTLSGLYKDFFSLGVGMLEMVGDTHGVKIEPADVAMLKRSMANMPPHSDANEGLRKLQEAGFRMVTLTNSPMSDEGTTPLENANLTRYFERQFSVDRTRVYKPSALLYRMVADEMGVPSGSCCMIACHVWDTIGAQSAGLSGCLITRKGNSALPISGLPQPLIIAPNLIELAAKIIDRWRPRLANSD